MVLRVSDVNLLIVVKPRIRKIQEKPAQIKAKNGQIIKVSVNPASPDADSKVISTPPEAKLKKMLSSSQRNRLPIPIPATRNLKRDFFEISLLSMTTETLQSVSSKIIRE